MAGLSVVADLIDIHTGNWKEDLVRSTFDTCEALQVLCIPLLLEGAKDSFYCCVDKSGTYTVRSGYRLLLRGFNGTTEDKYRIIEPHL